MNLDKIKFILNVLFMIGAVACVVIYFAFKGNTTLLIYACGITIGIKFIELSLRITKR